uniref:Kazal-like domain-containing protein n=1 Tax=Crocodylus porosus TaxID=8502 RepID=A0A7M4F4T6_CROPO
MGQVPDRAELHKGRQKPFPWADPGSRALTRCPISRGLQRCCGLIFLLQLDCSKYHQITTENGTVLVACPMIYDPLCGKDGKTYASECMLCNHNLEAEPKVDKKHSGPCPEDIPKLDCKKYREITVDNSTVLACTILYKPICGTDGKTYDSECKLCNHNLHAEPKDDCSNVRETNPICALFHQPHCGSDKQTYSNRCFFCNAVIQSNRTLTLSHYGEC